MGKKRTLKNKEDFPRNIFFVGLWVLILLPVLLCIILFVRVGKLEKELDEVRELNTAELSGSFEKKLHDMALVEEQEDAADAAEDIQDHSGEIDNPALVDRTKDALNPSSGESEPVSSAAVGSDKASQEDDGRKHVYLTFDDGPSDHTEELCEMLEENDMTATFFCIGKTDEYSKKMYQRIVDGGHTLAMHSYSHDYGSLYASLSSFKKDFYKVQDYFEEITGTKPTIYRFPGGSSNTVSKVSIKKCVRFLESEGVRYFDWNALNGDAEGKPYTVDQMFKRTIAGIKAYNTPVVLMHDTNAKENTFKMMPKLIRRLKKMDAVVEGITDTTPLVQHVKVEDCVK